LTDERTIYTLKNLGGFTTVIQNSLEKALSQYSGNPRAAPALVGIHSQLSARVPEIRLRVQSLLSRVNPESFTEKTRSEDSTLHREVESRYELHCGSHTEVELQASELRWRGIADLITLTPTRCEIRDFKTRTPKKEHNFQLRTYALLWYLDRDLNPSGRLASKLVLSYVDKDVDVPAPSSSALHSIEDEIKNRTTAALSDLQSTPPEARLNTEKCKYCFVRHLCEDYWQWNALSDEENNPSKGYFADIQVELSGQHGPSSWDGFLESPSNLKAGGAILLRTANLRLKLYPGQRLRLLNVHVLRPSSELSEAKRPTIVATMGASTEIFQLMADDCPEST